MKFNKPFIIVSVLLIALITIASHDPRLLNFAGFTTGTVDSTNDWILFQDVTDSKVYKLHPSSLGGADNLGNHIATQSLNMNSNQINNALVVNADSCEILNSSFRNAPTFQYQDYTATGTLNRELAHYWDGTTDDTLTTSSVLPDETPFFVKNNDPILLLTILPGAGHTISGDGRIYAGEGVWFQKHGTVIERITPFRHDYRADLSPTTDSNGDFTVTHNLNTTNVVYTFTPICDACRYSFRRKTTSGITSNTIVIRVYDESTGTPLASTSLSVSAMVQRIN